MFGDRIVHNITLLVMEDDNKNDSAELFKEAFINGTELIFSDISSEIKREYVLFSENKPLVIDGGPLYLNVSPSSAGGHCHRLYTDEGWCYYIKPDQGWTIRWKVRKSKPCFVK